MHGRYLIVGGTERHCPKLRAAISYSGLFLHTDWQDVALYCDASVPVVEAPDNNVTLLGCAFNRGTNSRVRQSPTVDTDDCMLAARRLAGSFWGAFVALIRIPGGDWGVLRDPSGHMPCFYTVGSNLTMLGSDATTISNCSRGNASIDRALLLDHLVFGNLQGAQTPLRDLLELLPGEFLPGRNPTLKIAAWSPWDFTRALSPVPFGEAVERVGSALEATGQAWARAFERPMVTLSGGLDSSIVATYAQRTTGQALCVNLFTVDPIGDERRHAEAVCRHIGAELVTEAYPDHADDLTRKASWYGPRPTAQAIGRATDRLLAAMLAEHGRQAIFNGLGGDNVFCFQQSAVPLLDCLLSDAGWRAVASTAAGLAGTTNSSLLAITADLARATWAYARHGSKPPRPHRTDFLRFDGGAERSTSNAHPWCHPPYGSLPAKARHVAAIAQAQVHLNRFPRHWNIANISPLLSTPLVEACLGIPSWLWCQGGEDRAVARAAAAGRLPATILHRRTKGSPVRLFSDTYYKQRDALGDFLLNGAMSSLGLLDCDAIGAYLASDRHLPDARYLKLLELCNAEGWCRHWQASAPQPHLNPDLRISASRVRDFHRSTSGCNIGKE